MNGRWLAQVSWQAWSWLIGPTASVVQHMSFIFCLQVLDEVIDETEADKQRAAEQKRRRHAAEQQKREK